MLKERLLKKMFLLTLSMLIILSICTIPTINDKNLLRTNLEIESITGLNTNSIYLLNKDNFLVKTEVFIDDKKVDTEVKDIINYLTINNSKIPKGLNGYLDKNLKILNISLEGDILEIDFSKELKEDEITITGVVYSLLEIKGIDRVKIKKEGKDLSNYNKYLDKSIGINNKYLYHGRKDIKKVVIYYLDNINNDFYFVPVTKYLSDKRDKIEIIVDELKNNKELVSVMNNKVELIEYSLDANSMFLNFNKELLDSNEDITNKILDEVAYSVFESYDINTVMFEVNGKRLDYRKRN